MRREDFLDVQLTLESLYCKADMRRCKEDKTRVHGKTIVIPCVAESYSKL